MAIFVWMTRQPVVAANPTQVVPDVAADPDLPSDGTFERAAPAQGDPKITGQSEYHGAMRKSRGQGATSADDAGRSSRFVHGPGQAGRTVPAQGQTG